MLRFGVRLALTAVPGCPCKRLSTMISAVTALAHLVEGYFAAKAAEFFWCCSHSLLSMSAVFAARSGLRVFIPGS